MVVYSVGYGNRSFPDFIELLKSHAVTHLVDVRSVPYSNYQQEFRRENLVRLIPGQGLRYVFMGDTLGGETARAADENPGALRSLDMGLDRLLKAASDPSARICLMCGCLLPDKCHRGKLLGRHLQSRGVEYLHLNREGQAVNHTDYLAAITGSQAALF